MCDFLLVNPCNLMPNAYLFHTLVEKLEFLITLPVFNAPVQWDSVNLLAGVYTCKKTRVIGLPGSKKIRATLSLFHTIPACDRRMDGQTDRRIWFLSHFALVISVTFRCSTERT